MVLDTLTGWGDFTQDHAGSDFEAIFECLRALSKASAQSEVSALWGRAVNPPDAGDGSPRCRSTERPSFALASAWQVGSAGLVPNVEKRGAAATQGQLQGRVI